MDIAMFFEDVCAIVFWDITADSFNCDLLYTQNKQTGLHLDLWRFE